MTNDEACKWLANLRQDIGNPHYERLWGYEQAICEIMSMLEEQEPKLVRYTESTVRCPNCNKQITTKGCIHREIKYCWKCGQAVKWE